MRRGANTVDKTQMTMAKTMQRTKTTSTEFGVSGFTPWLPFSEKKVIKPAEDLLLKYRHVYAGKGGKYSSPTASPSPRITNRSLSFGKYSKEILEKISRALKQQEVDAKANQVQPTGNNGQSSVNKAEKKPASCIHLNQDPQEAARQHKPHPSKHKNGITFSENVSYNVYSHRQYKKDENKLAATSLHSGMDVPTGESDRDALARKRSKGLRPNDTSDSTRKNMNLFSRMSVEAQAALKEMIPEGMTSHNTSYDVIDLDDVMSDKREDDFTIESDEENDKETIEGSKHSDLRYLRKYASESNIHKKVPPDKLHNSYGAGFPKQRTTDRSKGRCRTTLPHISSDQVTLTSDESAKGEPTREHVVPGIGRFSMVPMTGFGREATFKITPQGYDSRYTEPIRSFWNDTPEQIKAEATAKCSAWINKYM